MEDMQGILSEYKPLQIIRYGEVYGNDSEETEAWLSEYDFIWEPITELDCAPKLYLGGEPMRFGVEDKHDKADAVKRQLGQAPMRLPQISQCWGDESLMISDELAQELAFSAVLGVTRTPATIIDAAGDERTGYTAFSFHKTFFHERATQRLTHVPSEQRPIIKILLKRHSNTYLIHKSLLDKWQQLGVEDVCFDIKPKYMSIQKLCDLDMYFGSGGTRSFYSMADFVNKVNPSMWDDNGPDDEDE